MKKVLIIITALIFYGCSIDDGPSFTFEIRPIESVDIPTEFQPGQTHEILVTYTRPNGCYEFNSFIFETDGNTRTVGVVDTVYTDAVCATAAEEATVSFNFSASSLDLEPYIFQFYQGKDDNGEDVYLIFEVPVAE